jgi:hypothetical protein
VVLQEVYSELAPKGIPGITSPITMLFMEVVESTSTVRPCQLSNSIKDMVDAR